MAGKRCRLIQRLTTFSSRLRISIRRPLRHKSNLIHSQHRSRATLECSYTADRVSHLVLSGCPSLIALSCFVCLQVFTAGRRHDQVREGSRRVPTVLRQGACEIKDYEAGGPYKLPFPPQAAGKATNLRQEA